MASRKSASDRKNLVIVESPAKAKTINKYLGKSYIVKASMGHVRDLPERRLAIDVEDNFKPTYEIVSGRIRVVSELKKLAKDSDIVYLATDLDREGEAIAWHLVEALELPQDRIRRVIFNEITESAIRHAFEQPHHIDMDKVNAQQARRILDRIVGYELSPLLWKKIAKGLSAGRVQSVAVRLIVEREHEIRDYIPTEHWRIGACFTMAIDRAKSLAEEWRAFAGAARSIDGEGPKSKEQTEWLTSHHSFRAELVSVGGGDFKPEGRYDASAPPEKAFASAVETARKTAELLGFVCEKQTDEIWDAYKHRGLRTITLIGKLDPARAPAFRIGDVQTKRTKTRPSPPFTTAALQQAAANQLYFATSRTMRIAQQLYEGVDLGGGEGPVGLITYMRTDSTNLSKDSIEAVRGWIGDQCGPKYLPDKPNYYTSAKQAQEAHEAIRPTDVNRRPDVLRGHLTEEQWKLYDLIWKRFVACQMTPAEWDSTTAMIETDTSAGKTVFKASGRILAFDGFYRVTGVPKSGDEQVLPSLTAGQPVAPIEMNPDQHYTSPPPRYTEASLVKMLEAEGIGRPSTYAAIVQTIQDRGYVEQIERRFYATAKGEIVTEKLQEHFPEVMDIKFTSYMEEELDKIEEAHLDWVRVLHEFYDPFHRSLNKAHDEMKTARSEPSQHNCPTCSRPMVYRWARTGRFLSCSGYPECKTAYNVDRNGEPIIPKVMDTKCELCGKPMILRKSRTGMFLGCSGYPDCTSTIPCDESGTPLKLVKEEDIKENCDICGMPMAVKRKGRRAFLGCSGYPNCKNTKSLPEGIRLESKPAPPPEEAGFACEKCGRAMVIRGGRRGKFISCSGFPKCRNAKPIQKLEELKAAAEARQAARPSDDTSVPFDADDSSASATKKTRAKATPKNVAGSKASGESANTPEFLEHAKTLGYGVTRFGNIYREKVEEDQPIPCPSCGSNMTFKRGRFGPFLSCEGFPACKQIVRLRGAALEKANSVLGTPEKKPPPEPTDIDCEQCGAKMVIRVGRSGKFLGCSAYPKCRNTRPVPTDMLSLGTK